MNLSDQTYLILGIVLGLPMVIVALLNWVLRNHGGFAQICPRLGRGDFRRHLLGCGHDHHRLQGHRLIAAALFARTEFPPRLPTRWGKRGGFPKCTFQ